METILKYTIDESQRMFKIPIITIIPEGQINVKIIFQSIEITINVDEEIIITQYAVRDTQYFNLNVNENVIATKEYFFNDGNIIINGECAYCQTYKMYYDS